MKSGYLNFCKRCENQKCYVKRTSEYQRNWQLKVKFGITIDDYNKMLESQDYKCGICERHMTEFNKNLGVDHNHKTGDIRGLLCQFCNTGLGLFREDLNLIKKVCNYIERYN